MKLKDRICLITGGGRGIGRSIALAFAREGAHVAVSARTNSEIETVSDEVRALGRDGLAIVCDVAQKDGVDEMVKAVRERFGLIDVLVNNAGIVRTTPLLKCDEALWNQIIATNLTGTYFCTRAVIGGMIERGWGRVINIASIAGKTAQPYLSAYVASKHGVLGFTKSVALEVATKGVTVNAICPGYVDTPMTSQGIKTISERTGMPSDQVQTMLENLSPQKRFVQPEEVAALSLFLASDEAHGITGQAINVCGGSVLW